MSHAAGGVTNKAAPTIRTLRHCAKVSHQFDSIRFNNPVRFHHSLIRSNRRDRANTSATAILLHKKPRIFPLFFRKTQINRIRKHCIDRQAERELLVAITELARTTMPSLETYDFSAETVKATFEALVSSFFFIFYVLVLVS